MIEAFETHEKELFFPEPKVAKLTVEKWICPLCKKEKTTVLIDGGVEYGGRFWRGDGVEGCMDCWSDYL